MNVFEFALMIQKRPRMYLEKKSIKQLHDFIGGFLFAKEMNNISDPIDTLFQKEFYHFLVSELKTDKEISWKDLILKHEDYDDEKAFQSFFYFIAKFVENKT